MWNQRGLFWVLNPCLGTLDNWHSFVWAVTICEMRAGSIFCPFLCLAFLWWPTAVSRLCAILSGLIGSAAFLNYMDDAGTGWLTVVHSARTPCRTMVPRAGSLSPTGSRKEKADPAASLFSRCWVGIWQNLSDQQKLQSQYNNGYFICEETVWQWD